MRFLAIYLANFFFSIHFAITLYINSSFLKHFFPTWAIGLLYVAGALGNTYFFLHAPRLLSRFGSRKFLLFFLVGTFIATLGAAFAPTALDAAIFFLIYASVSMMIYYSLDLLLEEISSEGRTGEIRGIYLTVMNAAIMGGPLLIAYLGEGQNFAHVYFASALLLVPIFFLAAVALKLKKAHEIHTKSSLPWQKWLKSADLRHITLARFTLEFFYAIMTIYVPIYLHERIGFAWTEIGIIFTIMLMPFIIFEWPAGELADRYWGEKEILLTGLFLTGIVLLPMPFVGKSFLVWTVLLFISRIGASLIESMTEVYFFKHVDEEDAGLISIFRLSRTVGLVAGAGIGALVIALAPFGAVFLVLAIALFWGMHESIRLKDTK